MMARLYTALLVALLCTGIASAQSDTVSSPTEPYGEALAATKEGAVLAWDAGNRAYIDGNYTEALEYYTQILDEGKFSAKLYYNVGNTYFKLGDMGRAILYYNRALRLTPNADDVQHNLKIAQAHTKDNITQIPEFFLGRWVRTLGRSCSPTAWSIFSLASVGVMLVFLLLFLLGTSLRVRKAGFYGTLAALLLVIFSSGFALSERHDVLTREDAIVLSSAISVKSSPDRSATDLFILHEGTAVRILSEVEGWCEVVIADGKKGWTESSNVERI
ncbi:MAG: tetratricopeptide repeat protein [Alistipes sp.]|nr:tetratricopeptide repeat protein [Alistipes sp.]